MLLFTRYMVSIKISISTVLIVLTLSGTSRAGETATTAPVTRENESALYSNQTPSAQSPPPNRITGEYVKEYVNDTARILTSPAEWDGSDWVKAGLVIGATSGLFVADSDIRNFAQRNQSSTGKTFAAVGNALGNPIYTLPPLGLFYLYGHLNDDSKARRTSLLAVESLVVSGLFNVSVKLLTQRPRPFTGQEPATWNGPLHQTNDPAFPSFHTTAAFSIAAVLSEEYGTTPLVPPLAYGLASLTGLSRIYDNKHWASDVFFGAAIGYFVGKTVVRYHTAQGGTNLKIMPTVSQQGFGLTAEYRF